MITIQLKLQKRQISSSSAAMVASDDDLLTQIVLRLPAKSLLRLKCVSKHWLSLITSSYFSKLRIRHPIPAYALILHPSGFHNPVHEFVPFATQNPAKPPFRQLTFVDDPSGIRILQSCNGLLCCCSFRCEEPSRDYYIYNPTTKQFTTLSKPGSTNPDLLVLNINLAYDPSKSHHYKVTCLLYTELISWNYRRSSWCYWIDVYSSENRQWRFTGQSFILRHQMGRYKNGVYWNGAIHWLCGGEYFLSFGVNEEKLEKTPMPPAFNGWEETRIEYFGESCDHLHLIEVNSRQATLFNIYELERDRGEWLLRYHVNVEAVVTAFPHMIRHFLPPTDYHHYGMFVLDLIRGERDQEDSSFLVLHIPDKAIRYNLADGSFCMLCDFAPDHPRATMMDDEGDDPMFMSLQFHTTCAFQYIESLCIF